MLTAQDVEQKTFSTALRGYDLDEVDDFLDEIVATLKELNEMLEQSKSAPVAPAVSEPVVAEPEPLAEEPEAVQEAAPEPEPAPEAQAVAIDESAVGRALIAAQTAADRLLADAESEATRIVEDAKQQADTWESEKEAKKAEAQSEMANLAARVRAVRSELAVLAEQVSGNLDEMDTAIASSGVGVGDDSDEGDDGANEVAFLDTDGDESPGEAETGSEDTDSANGADHLDAILTGVATDLQLGEPGDDTEDDQFDDDESDESSESRDEDEA